MLKSREKIIGKKVVRIQTGPIIARKGTIDQNSVMYHAVLLSLWSILLNHLTS